MELTQDEAALDLVTITSHLLNLVRQFLNTFLKTSNSGVQSEHYQLYGTVAMRSREKAEKIKESIEIHCEGNPFTKNTPLKNIALSALIPDDAKSNILYYKERCQICFEEFIKDRLLLSSKISTWDLMEKKETKKFS